MNSRPARGSFLARLGPRFLPFADAATPELPLPRLLRLSLFQVSVGMALVLLNGTLNRVMIVELSIPASLVAAMVSLPILFAPLRALVGFKSDHHRSALGWRRVPYIWMGTMIQFGGLSVLPFALLLLANDGTNQLVWSGEISAALAFLLIGAGLHTTQTAGVSLATDLAPEEARPRVVALLYVMLLLGMVGSSLVFGGLLQEFSRVRLIQIVQGSAVVTLVLNFVALWKQEGRNALPPGTEEEDPSFKDSFRLFLGGGRVARLLVAVGVGGAGFNMQDILLEPYGGEIMHLSVGDTTALTALMAGGSLLGLGLAARRLSRGHDACHLAALGAMAGITGLSLVIFAGPLGSPLLFRAGTFAIGFGGGWFSVGTLTATMALPMQGRSGLAVGAWGAMQASAGGLGLFAGGALRDVVSALAVKGALGPGLISPMVGYSFVYHLEIALLFGALVAIGPLVRVGSRPPSTPARFGLAELPN